MLDSTEIRIEYWIENQIENWSLNWKFNLGYNILKVKFLSKNSIWKTPNIFTKAQKMNERLQLTSKFWSIEFSRAVLDATQNELLL